MSTVMEDKPLCPKCGEELLEAFCSPGYDRPSLGDYFCTQCLPRKDGEIFCYWRNEELDATDR